MVVKQNTALDLAKQYGEIHRQLPGSHLNWLKTLREHSLNVFDELGLPTVRDERWKYTNLNKIRKENFVPASHVSSSEKISLSLQEFSQIDAYQFVLINGSMIKSLSNIDDLPEGLDLKSIDEIGEDKLSRLIDFERTPMAALNTAAFTDALCFNVREGARIDKPIHLISVAEPSAEPVVFHPRFMINAGPNSKATLFESHVGAQNNNYFSNCVAEIELSSNATVHHYKMQNDHEEATHIAASEVRLADGANYENFIVTIGAKLSRNEINAKIIGTNADCRLLGIYLLNGKQHGDHTTSIDHAAPDSTSHEIYKGVLDDNARGVFQGKILVRKDSQRTNGYQLNQALLLSKGTEVDSKPELEIYADDVKCSHGATAGELDENALFYLRARGINEMVARNLLIEAFIKSAIDEISNPLIRTTLSETISTWLSTGKCNDRYC